MERRKRAAYIVSPYKLPLNEDNYYLLPYDGKKKKIIPHRVDSMKEVKVLDEPREGAEAFAAIDMETYTYQPRVLHVWRTTKACQYPFYQSSKLNR